MQNTEKFEINSYGGIEDAHQLKEKSPTNYSSTIDKYRFKIGAYIRLSPYNPDQVNPDEGSIKAHPSRLKTFVQSQNIMEENWGKIVGWYEDIEYSAKNVERPKFQSMLWDIKKGKINAILITELSRLTRSVKDWCHLGDFIDKYNVTIFSLREKVDTSSPAGKMIVNILISHAQYEREQTVERIKENNFDRAKRGLVTGATQMLGYDKHPEKIGYLVSNPSEVALVNLIFRKYLDLGSVGKLCDYLNKEGYTTKSYKTKKGKLVGGRKFIVCSLRKILSNKTYIGKKEINKKNEGKDQNTLKPRDQYKMVDATWQWIVPEAIFYKVQEKLEENGKIFRTKQNAYPFILQKILYCGECKKRYNGSRAYGRSDTYFYYRHNRRKTSFDESHKDRCRIEYIKALSLEERIISHLKHVKRNKKLLERLIEEANQKRLFQKPNFDELLNKQKRVLSLNEVKIGNLINFIATNPDNIANSSIKETIEQLQTQKNNIIQNIEKTEEKLNRIKSRKIDIENVFDLIEHLSENFHKLSDFRKSELLRAIFISIEVYPYYLKLTYGEGIDHNLLFNPEPAEQYLLNQPEPQKMELLPARIAAVGGSDVGYSSGGGGN